MRKSFRPWSSSLLILLFFSSSLLHTLVHDSNCCAESARSAFLGGSGIEADFFRPSAPEFIAVGKTILAHTEFFCPVCAGWLTADCPDPSGLPLNLHLHAVIPTGNAADGSLPAWMLPASRAPPAA